jgi:AraC-like DNA-binding protein
MVTEIINDTDYWKLYYVKKSEGFLMPFIECYWENIPSSCVTDPLTDRSLPHIGFTLRFNLEKPYYLKNAANTFFIDQDIFFPRNHTWKEFYVKDPRVFGIKFKFSFLPYLAGIDHIHFAENPFPAKDYISPEFVETIHRAGCFEERVALCSSYFTSIYETHHKKIMRQKIVLDLLECLYSNEENSFIVSEIAQKSFLSSKTLNRYFQKNVGITAKQSFRLLRTRKALESYIHSDKFNFFEWGYYDYSHFFREVQNITGLRLKELKPINKRVFNISASGTSSFITRS